MIKRPDDPAEFMAQVWRRYRLIPMRGWLLIRNVIDLPKVDWRVSLGIMDQYGSLAVGRWAAAWSEAIRNCRSRDEVRRMMRERVKRWPKVDENYTVSPDGTIWFQSAKK